MNCSVEVHNNSGQTRQYNLIASKPDVYNCKTYGGCVIEEAALRNGGSKTFVIPFEYCLFVGSYNAIRGSFSTGAMINPPKATHPVTRGSTVFSVDIQDGEVQMTPDPSGQGGGPGVTVRTGSSIKTGRNLVIGVGISRMNQGGTEYIPLGVCLPEPNKVINIARRPTFYVECQTELPQGSIVEYNKLVGHHRIDFSRRGGDPPNIVLYHEADGSWRRAEIPPKDSPNLPQDQTTLPDVTTVSPENKVVSPDVAVISSDAEAE